MIRKYPYQAKVGETKRAILIRVPYRKRPVRVPKQCSEWQIDSERGPVVLVEDHVAEFVGLIEEVSL